ncbi:MAG: stage II sporulation protein P [Clostridium sp.]
MNKFSRKTNIGSSNKGVKQRKILALTSLNLEYLLIIGVIILLLVRMVWVFNEYEQNRVYVKMLNVGMPIIETQVYDKVEVAESKLSGKDLFMKTLGLSKVNLTGIVASEVTYFKNAVVSNSTDGEFSIYSDYSDHGKGIESFKVNENTIVKITPEEIAELNDVSKAYNPSLKKILDPSNPEILLYHTHTMEAYAEAAGGQTDNVDANIVGVGEVLVKELEENYGISVVHDKTNYTTPHYPTAYDRSRIGLQKYLSEYNDFKLVIDLHRDGVDDKSLVTTTLNDQTLSKFLFVTAQNNSNYDANAKVVEDLYNIGNELFPEIIKPTRIFPSGYNGFNQEFANGSMIIEVGAHTNTAQEARLTAKYIARIIAEYINE